MFPGKSTGSKQGDFFSWSLCEYRGEKNPGLELSGMEDNDKGFGSQAMFDCRCLLKISCQKLAAALIYENLENDLVSSRQSGAFCFQSAINGYFNPDVDEFKKYKNRTNMKNSLIPPKGKGEITAAIGARCICHSRTMQKK
jgi:hypothetical protein